jgi:hypothetical protein
VGEASRSGAVLPFGRGIDEQVVGRLFALFKDLCDQAPAMAVDPTQLIPRT